MINKYKNHTSVKVQYSGSRDPKARDDAIVRALRKLDSKLRREGWRFDVERKRHFMTKHERQVLKRKIAAAQRKADNRG